MSAPLLDALRARFQRLIEEGLNGRAATLRLKLSAATGAHWGRAIRRTEQAKAAPLGCPRGKVKLDLHRSFLVELISQDGDMTKPELAGAVTNTTSVKHIPMQLAACCASFASHIKKDVGRDQWFKYRLPAIGPSRDALSSFMQLMSKPS